MSLAHLNGDCGLRWNTAGTKETSRPTPPVEASGDSAAHVCLRPIPHQPDASARGAQEARGINRLPRGCDPLAILGSPVAASKNCGVARLRPADQGLEATGREGRRRSRVRQNAGKPSGRHQPAFWRMRLHRTGWKPLAINHRPSATSKITFRVSMLTDSAAVVIGEEPRFFAPGIASSPECSWLTTRHSTRVFGRDS